jgi:hypothetical protein
MDLSGRKPVDLEAFGWKEKLEAPGLLGYFA